jgi:hypothetical protein
MEEHEKPAKGFNVTCEDGTKGRVCSPSPEKVKELAQDMV